MIFLSLKVRNPKNSIPFHVISLQVKNFATSLLDHARTSYELEIMLNYRYPHYQTVISISTISKSLIVRMLAFPTCSVDGDIWDPGETQTLNRLKLALTCKQKAIDMAT